MIGEIPPGAFEIPDYALWTLSGWVLSILITAWIGYRLGLRSQERTEIRAERANFVPLLKQAISECSEQFQPLHIWREHRGEMKKSAGRFSTFLKGRRKTAFDSAWQKYNETKPEEHLDGKQQWFTAESQAEMAVAQKIIKTRLQALLDAVEAA